MQESSLSALGCTPALARASGPDALRRQLWFLRDVYDQVARPTKVEGRVEDAERGELVSFSAWVASLGVFVRGGGAGAGSGTIAARSLFSERVVSEVASTLVAAVAEREGKEKQFREGGQRGADDDALLGDICLASGGVVNSEERFAGERLFDPRSTHLVAPDSRLAIGEMLRELERGRRWADVEEKVAQRERRRTRAGIVRSLSTALFTTDDALSRIGLACGVEGEDRENQGIRGGGGDRRDQGGGENREDKQGEEGKSKERVPATVAGISVARRKLRLRAGQKVSLFASRSRRKVPLVASTAEMQDLSRACLELTQRMRRFARDVKREVPSAALVADEGDNGRGLGNAAARLGEKAKLVDSLFRDAKAAREAVESMAWGGVGRGGERGMKLSL